MKKKGGGIGMSRLNIEELRKEYPKGTRIELIYVKDQSLPQGTKGTIRLVESTGLIIFVSDKKERIKLNLEYDDFEVIA